MLTVIAAASTDASTTVAASDEVVRASKRFDVCAIVERDVMVGQSCDTTPLLHAHAFCS